MTDLIPGGSLAVCAAALAALFGLLFAAVRSGIARERAKAKTREAEGYIKTRKETDDAEVLDDPALAARWLQSRNPDQP